MNIFLPQSTQTQIELAEIADVNRQVISPATSTPIIGIVQDGLLGAYNLTDPSIKIDWRDAMNIISYTTIDDFTSIKKDKQYQGKEIFSLIVPPKISTNIGGLDIKNGQIKSGQVHKAHLGSKKRNSLIHLIWDEYGIIETKNFIDNTQRLVNNYNLINGFTVGIGDINIPKDVREQLNKMIETKKLDVNHLITEMENNPDLLDNDLFEESILSELNAMLGDVSKIIMNNLKPENHFGIMINSGSKGGPINMGQMAACVAQANVEGKRIRKKFNGRSLQYYHKNDDSAIARGFIQDSFLEGLEPKAFILHNMGSREGLIDTAIKTASTGYIQRKLIKSTEDAMIKYDLTVRNANDTILQFTYGDNGIDSTKQSHVTLKLLSMGNKEVSNKFKFTKQELKNYPTFSSNDNDRYYEDLLGMRNLLRNSIIKSTMNEITLKDTFMIPVNLYRIISNVSNSDNKFGGGKLTPDYVLKKLDDILDYKNTMISCMSKEDSEKENSLKYRDELTSKTLFKFALHEHLGPKISILNHHLTKGKFDEIYRQIKENFNKSVVEAGEMVGTIGAQSIGEPLTQLTLNTFHSAGIGAKGTTTLGVPRMNELLSFSKNMKTPQMRIYLQENLRTNITIANKIASSVKYTILKDIIKNVNIYYNPDPYKKDSFMDRDNAYNIFHSYKPSKYSCQSDLINLPWLMRIELDREALMDKDIALLDIKSKFCNFWEKRFNDTKGMKKDEKQILDKVTQCAIISNNINDRIPIIHIRFDMIEFNLSTITGFLEKFIEPFKLKGIDSIENVDGLVDDKLVNFNNDDKELRKEKQYQIYTKGINLKKIRYINGIDVNNTRCNDIVVIYHTFGIEAARAALMFELNEVFEGSGNTVNYQHLSILIDIMTNNGKLTSIDRHGLNNLDTDPLARASFEKTVDQLIAAAVFGEVDKMRSVSSRIMAGLVVNGGTGLCDLVLDTNMLQNSEYIEELEQKYEKTFNELSIDNVVDDVMNKGETNDIFIPQDY